MVYPSKDDHSSLQTVEVPEAEVHPLVPWGGNNLWFGAKKNMGYEFPGTFRGKKHAFAADI